MSIELKEAAQQAIEAIQDLRGYRPDIDKAIEALRTAIQQVEAQQPAVGEPVTVVKSIHISQGALKCTNGTQNTLLLQQEAGAVGDTKTPENGFQEPLAQDLSTKAGASQVEPFAHICIVNTKDAGPTKFFTAPSDPRAIPLYTHPAPIVPATTEPVQTTPNFTQLMQILDGLNRCHSRDSKVEFLRSWIRDWTQHKVDKLTHPAPSVLDDVVRDAERYRWLRDRDHWPAPFASSQDPEPVRGIDLDAAIDAAMLAAKKASA